MTDLSRPKVSGRFKAAMISAMGMIGVTTALIVGHERNEIRKYKARAEAEARITYDAAGVAMDLLSVKNQGGISVIGKKSPDPVRAQTGAAFETFCLEANSQAGKPLVTADPNCNLYATVGIVGVADIVRTVDAVASRSGDDIFNTGGSQATSKNAAAIAELRSKLDKVVTLLPPPANAQRI